MATSSTHSTWEIITTHTAKCDKCERKGASFCLRCPECSYQACSRCAPAGIGDAIHDIAQDMLHAGYKAASRTSRRLSRLNVRSQVVKGKTRRLRKMSRRQRNSSARTGLSERMTSTPRSPSVPLSTSPSPPVQIQPRVTPVYNPHNDSVDASSSPDRESGRSLSSPKLSALHRPAASTYKVCSSPADDSSTTTTHCSESTTNFNTSTPQTFSSTMPYPREWILSRQRFGTRQPPAASARIGALTSNYSMSTPLDILADVATAISGIEPSPNDRSEIRGFSSWTGMPLTRAPTPAGMTYSVIDHWSIGMKSLSG